MLDFLVPPAAAFAALMGRYLHGPPSSRLKSSRDSSPGQQRALFSPAAGAASEVSCLFPGHSSGSVPILCQNSLFSTQILLLGKASPPLSLPGLPLLALFFSRPFLPARPTSAIAAGEFSPGEEFHGKIPKCFDFHRRPPLKAGLKSREGPAKHGRH